MQGRASSFTLGCRIWVSRERGAGEAALQQAVPAGQAGALGTSHWSCQERCCFGGCSPAARGRAVQSVALSRVGTQSLPVRLLLLTSCLFPSWLPVGLLSPVCSAHPLRHPLLASLSPSAAFCSYRAPAFAQASRDVASELTYLQGGPIPR